MVTFKRFTRLSALVFAVVFLLGVFVSGCSDQDRDKGSGPIPDPSPEPATGTVLRVLVDLSDVEVAAKSNVPSNVGIMSLGLYDENGNLICESKNYVDGSKEEPQEGVLPWLTPADKQCLLIFNIPDEAVEDFYSLMVRIRDNNGNHLGFLTKGDVEKTAWTAGESVLVDFTPDGASQEIPYAVAKPWIKDGNTISLTVDKDSIETRRARIDSLTVWVGTKQSQGCVSKAGIKCAEDQGVIVDFTDPSMPAYIDADTVAKKIAEAAEKVGGYGIAIVPSPIMAEDQQSGTLILDVNETLGTYLCQIITGREGNLFTAFYVRYLCDTGFGCKDINVTIDETGKVATVTAPLSNVALDSIAYYNGINVGSIPIYLYTAE